MAEFAAAHRYFAISVQKPSHEIVRLNIYKHCHGNRKKPSKDNEPERNISVANSTGHADTHGDEWDEWQTKHPEI